jgi:hypothetical protein
MFFSATLLNAQSIHHWGQGGDGRLLTFYNDSGSDDAMVHIGHQEDLSSLGSLPSHNLYVEDGISTEAIFVKNPTDWADFVFEETYFLMSLDDVEEHINNEKHLPNVPSEKELIKQGYYDQHEINKMLLQKIEELTLYIIEQQKEIDYLQSENEQDE